MSEQSDPLSLAIDKRDREILSTVSDALRTGRTLFAFQPVVSASDPTRVAFHSAFMRLRDTSGRIIPARDFMPQVEMSELGRMIDTKAITLALQALRTYPTLRLSIKVSARSVGYRPWLTILNRALDAEDELGERLILDFTETSVIAVPDLITGFMDDVQMRGVSFGLDGFGAGATSFRCLRDMFFDVVKLDGDFVQDIHQNLDNQVLVKALISVCKSFDMFSVGVKVSNQKDADFLIDAGIDCLQGFHFGAPTTSLDETMETAKSA